MRIDEAKAVVVDDVLADEIFHVFRFALAGRANYLHVGCSGFGVDIERFTATDYRAAPIPFRGFRFFYLSDNFFVSQRL